MQRKKNEAKRKKPRLSLMWVTCGALSSSYAFGELAYAQTAPTAYLSLSAREIMP